MQLGKLHTQIHSFPTGHFIFIYFYFYFCYKIVKCIAFREIKFITVLYFLAPISCFFLTFYFYFILLYNTVLVLPYIDMNPPRVYMRSQT